MSSPLAVFEAFVTNQENLWVTDGTVAGTSQLTVTNSYPSGLFSSAGLSYPDFTVFNGDLLFEGDDANDAVGLWVTNGTSAGTSELTITGAYSGLGGPLDGINMNFTVFGNEVVFASRNGTGAVSLAVTNGTSAGTGELIVSQAYPPGFDPSDLTVLGNKVIFEGVDAQADFGLWVTDGTSVGTSELRVANAYFGGVEDTVSYSAPDLTVFGSNALFEGVDANDHLGLWVTDGTSAGTIELMVAGAYSGGLFAGSDSGSVYSDFTVLGSKVLFEGLDASGRIDLWVTDGTSAGTSELTVAKANPFGLGSPTIDPDFTVFGSMAVFRGVDTSGYRNLWVTDGTSAGTSELPVAGSNASGVFASGVGPDFTVFAGKVLFVGLVNPSEFALWVTDGTSAGTSELAPCAGDPDFTVLGTKVLFEGEPGLTNYSLWVTDGTVAGTSALAVPGPYFTPSYITVLPPPAAGQVIMVSPGPQTVIGAAGDTIIGGSGPDLINGILGAEQITSGSGATTVWGGAGDTIAGGTGSLFVDGSLSGQKIGGGSGASLIIAGASDTITGSTGLGASTVIGVKGDTITGGSGSDLINGIPGPQQITGGSGSTTVWGGAGDTITGGAGKLSVDGSLGGQKIGGGSGASLIIAGAGDTITGSTGSGATTVIGAKGDTITGGSGADLINGTLGSQSIAGTNGSTTVWGGSGDMITGGTGKLTVAIDHVHFPGAELVSDNGVKGSDTVTGFSQSAGDRIHFPNDTTAAINSVVATAQSSNGNTLITLPDGATLTLIGIAKIDNTFFA